MLETRISRKLDRSSDIPPAIAHAQEKSRRNVQDSFEQLLRWAGRHGHDHEEIRRRVEQTIHEVQGDLVMAYYETLNDLQLIIETGMLKNIFEHSPTERAARIKAGSSGFDEEAAKRRQIETELGWGEGESVYHLVAEQRQAGLDPEGPSGNYGAVRLVFSFNDLADHSTFTEGDSMNPDQLPLALGNKARQYSSLGMGYAARVNYQINKRVLAKDDVARARALFNVANELEGDQTKGHRFLRYIEAQVGGISGEDIMQSLQAIEIDAPRAFAEVESRLLSPANWKEINERYVQQSPRSLTLDLDHDDPSPRTDWSAVKAELTHLYNQAFTRKINAIRQWCASRNVAFVIHSEDQIPRLSVQRVERFFLIA